MNQDMSIFSLVLHASAVVQLVMAGLLAATGCVSAPETLALLQRDAAELGRALHQAERLDHRQRRDAVQHPMLAGRAQPILDPATVEQGCNFTARILQIAGDKTGVRGLAAPEADDA